MEDRRCCVATSEKGLNPKAFAPIEGAGNARRAKMSRKLDLQDFLPYLLNRAGLRVGLMFSRDIEAFDVTLPMWRVLIELWYNGDHRLGELSERTSIDISTLSRLLVAMQRKNLIVRRRSGLDGRALSLTLTPRGLALTEKVAPYAVRYEGLAMKGMNAREVATLKDLLKRVYLNLEKADRAGNERPAARKRPAKALNAPKKKRVGRSVKASA
jgi:MarR family transcriptional regulator, organic hydroperoxide resistance regulator